MLANLILPLTVIAPDLPQLVNPNPAVLQPIEQLKTQSNFTKNRNELRESSELYLKFIKDILKITDNLRKPCLG